MNKITLENFRCFREKQEARLAPLTLLVGENSTGKTSFLALIRALWDAGFGDVIPNFKEPPYDLGSYDEIAHYRGGKSGRAGSFVAGFDTGKGDALMHHELIFEREVTAPVPVKRTVIHKDMWLKYFVADNRILFCPGKKLGEWEWKFPFSVAKDERGVNFQTCLFSFYGLTSTSKMLDSVLGKAPKSFLDNASKKPASKKPDKNFLDGFFGLESNRITEEDIVESLKNKKPPSKKLSKDDWGPFINIIGYLLSPIMSRPFAGAPVRSKPRRTYDPARPTPDPEGEYIPMYLAEMHFRGGKEWDEIKGALDDFGKRSGLFDQFTVKRYGATRSAPFQLHVKKSGGKLQGPWRNLIDVGYGVSQALPAAIELLHPKAPETFLMQQPEVHLHPSAQAALGSLFCELAGEKRRRLVVETHSDHLLERVRLDIRDGKTNLNPEDVSILYFERNDIEVKIHSLGLDQEGNVLNAPPSYGKFFMEETKRSLQL